MDEYKEPIYTEEFDDEYKERVLNIIEKSMRGQIDNNCDAAILFHWVRHQNDPAYAFVPEEYRGYK